MCVGQYPTSLSACFHRIADPERVIKVKHTSPTAWAAGALVGTVVASVLMLTPQRAAAASGITIPLLEVPLKSQTLQVPLTIPGSSVLIEQSTAIDVDSDDSVLKDVTPQISGASCADGGGAQWTCAAPAGGWVAGTIDLTMYADASEANTYLGYLSLEGKDFEVDATSPGNSSIFATGGYTFDFAGTTPPPENTAAGSVPKATKQSAPTTTGRSAASTAVGAGVKSAEPSADASVSPSSTPSALTTTPGVGSSAAVAPQVTSSPTRLAIDAVASAKSSSDGATVLAGAAAVLLLAGGAATGVYTRRRHRIRSQTPGGTPSGDGGPPGAAS